MPTRRFPAPWTFEDHNDACFIVKGANGVAVAYPAAQKASLPSILWFKTRLHYTKETLGNFIRDLPVA
jgi:hypothetical protein